MSKSEAAIHLAFRFHGNFYHSYRGDTPDELGFGKDIRIIRRIIEVLDEFNAKGVPVRGTWDIENYFSYDEKIMPEHSPDIIESLKRRVADGMDEVQVMSYNNGLISAHTAVEFDEAIGRALANSRGSGLKDLFSDFAAMVRPQEMMYTPMHLKMYPVHGIDSISLFYSAVPFNGFSNFMPLLDFEESFNPMTLTYPGIDETMIIVPARNHGDIADNISLRMWIKRLRRRQLRSAEPRDLLLLIDADADDEYWYGYDWPIISRILTAAQGLRGLIDNVRDLEYVKFTTPGEYLKTHPPMGTITVGQDTADGSFDGYSSWAEKWSNHRLWTGIERSRVLELQCRRLMESAESEEVSEYLAASLETRLRAMSTTHFGLSSPVMNVTRLKVGAALVQDSVDNAASALKLAAGTITEDPLGETELARFSLFDYARGISTDTIKYQAKPSRALVSIPLAISESEAQRVMLNGPNGGARPFAVNRVEGEGGSTGTELLFVEKMDGGRRKDYRIELSADKTTPAAESPTSIDQGTLRNEFIKIDFDKNMQAANFEFKGEKVSDGVFFRSAINYAGRMAEATHWKTAEADTLGNGLVSVIRAKAEIPFQADIEKPVSIEREFRLAAGLPYLYVTTTVSYPRTRSDNFNKRRAIQLEQEYDGNWREVMPCEIRPALLGRRGHPLRIWKHNYVDHMSCYDLNYGEFSKNAELDSINNHITHAWVAASNGTSGLLVAQTADVNSCFAFCPMRLKTTPEGERLFMNPFGAYYGKQLKYVTAYTGLGKLISEVMAESLDSFAVSYNGRSESFSLMIAPYAGDEPPEEIRNDAEAFAYPYAVVSGSDKVAAPSHAKWAFPEDIHPK